MGLVLLAFGILGLIDNIGFFDTGGDTVAGLNTNGALSVLSIGVGAAAVRRHGHRRQLRLDAQHGPRHPLHPERLHQPRRCWTPTSTSSPSSIQNVLFSFVVGIMLMCVRDVRTGQQRRCRTTTRTGGPATRTRPRRSSGRVRHSAAQARGATGRPELTAAARRAGADGRS